MWGWIDEYAWRLDMSQLKRVVIKEELVKLTGDYKKAIILQQFIYWSERTKDVDKFLAEEKKRLADHGIDETDAKIDFQNGWIYKTAEELNDEIMLGMTKTGISPHIRYLVEKGWIDSRRNPKYKWDRTMQYRVNIIKIQKDLHNLGYSLEGYPLLQDNEMQARNLNIQVRIDEHASEKISLQGEKFSLQNSKNLTAIPEITTENTIEIKKEEEGDADDADPFRFYQENIMLNIKPFVAEEIVYWIDSGKFEKPKTVIVEAMKIAVRKEAVKNKWDYANKLLIDWSDKGLRTIEKIRNEMQDTSKSYNVSNRKSKQESTFELLKRMEEKAERGEW
jgi:DnaD/phage-associated family protein